MQSGAAVLFMTHQWNSLIRLRFERLKAEVGDAADVLILMQKSDVVGRVLEESPEVAKSLVVFDKDLLPEQLGYPYTFDNMILPGSLHFPILAFFNERTEYEYCFLIEYDVEFSGNWGDLVLETLNQSPDFASLHFFDYSEKPDWYWWSHYWPGPADRDWALDKSNMKRSFNVIYCLSRHAAELVNAAHRGGWRCHNEILLATICKHYECKIVDLSKSGEFCVGNEQDALPGMYWTDISTVRWRPDVTEDEFFARTTGRTLFHPVKDPWFFDGSRIIRIVPSPRYALCDVVWPSSPD